MALNGTTLGDEIVTAIAAMESETDGAEFWATLCGAVVDHIHTNIAFEIPVTNNEGIDDPDAPTQGTNTGGLQTGTSGINAGTWATAAKSAVDALDVLSVSYGLNVWQEFCSTLVSAFTSMAIPATSNEGILWASPPFSPSNYGSNPATTGTVSGLDGDAMGQEIKDALDAVVTDPTDSAYPSAVWRAFGGALVSHIQDNILISVPQTANVGIERGGVPLSDQGTNPAYQIVGAT